MVHQAHAPREGVRAVKRSGRKPQIELALDAWRIWSKRRRFGPLFMAMLSIYLIIPAWVALAMANSVPPKETGGGLKATKDENVRALIRRMEERLREVAGPELAECEARLAGRSRFAKVLPPPGDGALWSVGL